MVNLQGERQERYTYVYMEKGKGDSHLRWHKQEGLVAFIYLLQVTQLTCEVEILRKINECGL